MPGLRVPATTSRTGVIGPPPSQTGCDLGVAGLGFAIGGPLRAGDGSDGPFRIREGSPAVRLRMVVAPPPLDGLGRVLFDPGSFWTARAHPHGFAIAIESPAGSGRLSRLAVMDPAWANGDIYLHPDLPFPGHHLPPLAWPLDTLLTASLLVHRNGLLFHGAGLVIEGTAYLFTGPSGAGKSTLVKLLERQRGVAVLNDERCIVRREAGTWRLYGTPWHGEVDRVAYGGDPLKKIFVLARAAEHRAVTLPRAEGGRHLFGRCLWPFWDRAGMEGGLATLEALCQEVPAFQLRFRRDEGVLACILE